MGMGMYGVMSLLLGGGEYCLNCILYIQFFLKSVVLGHGRGKRLGMCLVLEPHVSCVTSLQHVSML